MSVAVNTFHYILPYYDIFGGVSALTREQFETVNGFPNNFWSWGGEDDDLYFRVKYHNYLVSRYSATIARYTMLPHKKVENTSKNIGKLNHQESFATNGLNSIEYRLLNVTLHRLYTWVLVDIGTPHT
ncbi:Beta-1,4-galactosyltransferase 3, partial [Tyrophagus putrescentiae]